jgi:hypothetical protein
VLQCDVALSPLATWLRRRRREMRTVFRLNSKLEVQLISIITLKETTSGLIFAATLGTCW